jgi:hypothetical protein
VELLSDEILILAMNSDIQSSIDVSCEAAHFICELGATCWWRGESYGVIDVWVRG